MTTIKHITEPYGVIRHNLNFRTLLFGTLAITLYHILLSNYYMSWFISKRPISSPTSSFQYIRTNKLASPFLIQKNKVLQLLQNENSWKYPEIDAVYTWVNGSIKEWQKEKDQWTDKYTKHFPNLHKESKSSSRFRNHNELKYSIRSIFQHAPWIRYIHIVVADGQYPNWLNISHPRIQLVNHTTIFKNHSHLPTYNSGAIESNLDNIPNLAKYFIYFNDDWLFGLPVDPKDFLDSKFHGVQKLRYEYHFDITKICAPKCKKEKIGNGICDKECMTSDCGWDHGDCGKKKTEEKVKEWKKERRNKYYMTGGFVSQVYYTNGIFNHVFGRVDGVYERKPYGHLPILISRDLMKDMKKQFAQEFEITSSHHFRSPYDMQFAFSNSHFYKMNRVYAPTRDQLWRQALITMYEISSPLVKDIPYTFLYGKERKEQKFYEEKKKKILQSKSFDIFYQCTRKILLEIQGLESLDMDLKDCFLAVDDLLEKYEIRLPIEYEIDIHRTKDYEYVAPGNHKDRMLRELKQLSTRRKKFMCIQDAMEEDDEEIDQAYIQFYTTVFPHPAPSEI